MNKPSNLLSIKWTSFDLSFIIRTSWGGRYIIFMNFIIHQFILQTEQKILVVEVTTGAFAVVVCIIVKLRKPTIGNLSYNLQLYNITIQLPIHTTSNINQTLNKCSFKVTAEEIEILTYCNRNIGWWWICVCCGSCWSFLSKLFWSKMDLIFCPGWDMCLFLIRS